MRYVSHGNVYTALQQRNVKLDFQPIVEAASPHFPVFYEALIRLKSDEHGDIPASKFFPLLAHDRRALRDLARKSLTCGLETLAEEDWATLSLNVSSDIMQSEQWVSVLNRALDKDADLGPRLILEVTEHVPTSRVSELATLIGKLKKKGVRFVLDDFGSGLTSFRALKGSGFDYIKIYEDFSKDICHDPDNQVIVESMVAIAKQLGMETIAEKVRCPVDARVLADLGVNYLQGFYFKEAGPLDQICSDGASF